MQWREYRAMTEQDGVSWGESEHEMLTEDGRRIVGHWMIRHVEGRLLKYVIPVQIQSLDDQVPRYIQRQAAVQLRLAVEKYIFPL